MKTTLLFLSAFLGLFTNAANGQDKWVSADGKVITAQFIAVSGNMVSLMTNGRQYDVPMEKLSPQSQGYANFLQIGMVEWAHDNMNSAILDEDSFAAMMRLIPNAMEGRTFIVRCRLEAVGAQSALSKVDPAQIHLDFANGLRAVVDRSTDFTSSRHKLAFQNGKAVRLEAQTFGFKKSNFRPEKVIYEPGQAVPVRLRVGGGAPSVVDVPSEESLLDAKMQEARNSGNTATVSDLERKRIRLKFLEASLKEGPGGASVRAIVSTGPGPSSIVNGQVDYEYSDAEKAAMKQEIALLKAELGIR